MTRLLVRFGKRHTSWETPDVVEIRKIEFRKRNGDPDLRPSAYDVDASELARTYAEHAAAARIDPLRVTSGIDFAGTGVVAVGTPGNEWFNFTRERHRELPVPNIGALEHMIELALQDHIPGRYQIAKAEVRAYAQSRLNQNDAEWLHCANSAHARSWLKKLSPDAD